MKARQLFAIAAATCALAIAPTAASAAVWNDGAGLATAWTMPAGGNDVMHGLDLNDTLHGNDFDDVVHGDLGNDTLFGDVGNDWVYGDDGADTLYGGTESDFLSGGRGNDLLNSVEPDGVADYLDCGPGWDTANIHGEDNTDNCEVVNIRP